MRYDTKPPEETMSERRGIVDLQTTNITDRTSRDLVRAEPRSQLKGAPASKCAVANKSKARYCCSMDQTRNTRAAAAAVVCLVVVLLLQGSLVGCASPSDVGKCQRIDIQPCQDFYNFTYYPNPVVDVDSQSEAARIVHEFKTLFRINCAPLLRFFVCSMYVPMCYERNGVPEAVYSCRPICERAKAGCEPIMTRFGFLWPETLDCDKLPVASSPQSLCMSAPLRNDTTNRAITGMALPQLTTAMTSVRITEDPWSAVTGNENTGVLPRSREGLLQLLREKGIAQNKNFDWRMFEGKTIYNITFDLRFLCDLNSKFVYVHEQGEQRCLQRCNATVRFSVADKRFSDFWTGTWALICFVSTLLTASTFCVDTTRFRYPERPIVFLSICYNLCSVAYFVRMSVGRDAVICRPSHYGSHVVVVNGKTAPACTVVFALLYFFTMAAAAWWVVLSLTWFLSAALKWGHEAVQKYSSIFHALAWITPAVQTIVVLVTKRVDGDELSGICFVGNSSSTNLLSFVIIPLLAYLVLGSMFLFAGFVALFKIRRILRRKTNTFKLERLMFRIGMFTVLYIVPASFVVGCFLNEYVQLRGMEATRGTVADCLLDAACVNRFAVGVEVIYLKHFMLLVVGVTSGIWIWTSKTLSSWRLCLEKCSGRHGNKHVAIAHSQRVAGLADANTATLNRTCGFQGAGCPEQKRTAQSRLGTHVQQEQPNYQEQMSLAGVPLQQQHQLHHQQPLLAFAPFAYRQRAQQQTQFPMLPPESSACSVVSGMPLTTQRGQSVSSGASAGVTSFVL